MDKRITNAIAIVALVLWTVSFILDAVLVKYEPPISVHAVMMIVAGAAFAKATFKRAVDAVDRDKDESDS